MTVQRSSQLPKIAPATSHADDWIEAASIGWTQNAYSLTPTKVVPLYCGPPHRLYIIPVSLPPGFLLQSCVCLFCLARLADGSLRGPLTFLRGCVFCDDYRDIPTAQPLPTRSVV
eukprot:EG_transcript_33135